MNDQIATSVAGSGTASADFSASGAIILLLLGAALLASGGRALLPLYREHDAQV